MKKLIIFSLFLPFAISCCEGFDNWINQGHKMPKVTKTYGSKKPKNYSVQSVIKHIKKTDENSNQPAPAVMPLSPQQISVEELEQLGRVATTPESIAAFKNLRNAQNANLLSPQEVKFYQNKLTKDAQYLGIKRTVHFKPTNTVRYMQAEQ